MPSLRVLAKDPEVGRRHLARKPRHQALDALGVRRLERRDQTGSIERRDSRRCRVPPHRSRRGAAQPRGLQPPKAEHPVGESVRARLCRKSRLFSSITLGRRNRRSTSWTGSRSISLRVDSLDYERARPRLRMTEREELWGLLYNYYSESARVISD
eukprot:scaffold9550_cov111-Isochrysis_galbana.AAC.7